MSLSFHIREEDVLAIRILEYQATYASGKTPSSRFDIVNEFVLVVVAQVDYFLDGYGIFSKIAARRI